MDIEKLTEKAAADLAGMPELAFNENATKAYIRDFIGTHTDLELHDRGRYLYAVHREEGGDTLAFRADFDAVPTTCGAAHLCGHNGHTASLLGLALLLSGKRIGRSAVLLFQPAEETGEGAPACLDLFDKERIDAIIGAHNIPGEPFAAVILKHGTFACASCGMEIKLKGRPAHAAYPENGINPTAALAELALRIPELASSLSREYGCMTLATPVGLKAGERAFGMSASDAELWITLRSESAEAFERLVKGAGSLADSLAARDRLGITVGLFDEFPATVNDRALVDAAENVLNKDKLPYKYIEVPFRWSEDFGHYAARTRSLFMGIGSGTDTAPLHTAQYAYPKGLAFRTARIFFCLACGIRF